MLKPLIPYSLKKWRLKQKLTLKDVAFQLEIDKSYVSKIENNAAIPKDRIIKQMYHLYHIKKSDVDLLTFNETYIHSFLSKLYYNKISKNDIDDLNFKIQQHQFSNYLGHLKLISWCYHFLQGNWTDELIDDIKNFESLLPLFSSDEKRFFILCYLFYLSNIKSSEQYQYYLEILNNDTNKKWQGMLYYIQANYSYTLGNCANILKYMNKAKKQFEIENNYLGLTMVKYYKVVFYQSIQHYEEALDICQTLINTIDLNIPPIYKKIINQQIAYLYLKTNQYHKAIQYYQQCLTLTNNYKIYFELAWCYYKTGNFTDCLDLIQRENLLKNHIKLYSDLMTWLKNKIRTNDLNASIDTLLNIEKSYTQIMHHEINKFIITCIADDYYEMNDYKVACFYYRKVVNKEY